MDRENLLSVLVLAEIRLNSSWVLEPRREHADVWLCRQEDYQKTGNFRPLICCTDLKSNSTAELKPEDGFFVLGMDSSGVPIFSELVSVLNQVDTWLEKHSNRLRPVPRVPVKNTASVPTLTHVMDQPEGQTSVKLGSEISNSLESSGKGLSREKRSWLGTIAEYIHNVDVKSDNFYHKILIQSGEVVLIDFEECRFYSSIEIQVFLEGVSLSKKFYMSAIDKAGLLSELEKKIFIERPLSNLKWFMALHSNFHNLEIDAENTVFRLSGWPSVSLPGLRAEHLKVAAFMRTNKASLVDIAAGTGMDVEQVKGFVEACFYEGLIIKDTKNKKDKKEVQKPSSGLWDRVLRKIKR
ncbi:hypothetical protein [Marinobacterium sp. BA1]|uniref:hypothetical protein n=1 Tax=Marinobacterium sp. BA1 TaxID=3138931 RepID=UPI0034E87554